MDHDLPAGFTPYELQLPQARTRSGWLIRSINFDASEDQLKVDLVEMLFAVSMEKPREASIVIRGMLSFRAADEGELCHYWHVRDSEKIDPSTSIYEIQSSAYLKEVSQNTLVGFDSELRHLMVAGDDMCLEFICDEYTKIEISLAEDK